MSTKRTSTESNNDEQTTEDSGEAQQQEDNAKRGKFASFSDTTLQDIPTEILQCILIKAVAMEVKTMKLAKSVWKEKADLVISRLGSVCSQWSFVVATDFFEIDLHRALDGIAQEKIRMEVVSESMVNYFVLTVATLKDEILMLCFNFHKDSMTSVASSSYSIAVYDRNNLEEVKEVITLPGIRKGRMAACNVSNCVYVLNINEELHCASVLRLTRDEEHKFNIQTWISDLRFPISSGSLSVSDNGNLIIIQRPEESGLHAVSVYNPNGSLLHEVMLSPDIYGFICIDSCITRKSNGNLVLALVNRKLQMVLTEIDTNGFIQRQFKPSPHRFCSMNFADNSGRILILDMENRIELLDSELNLLEFTGPKLDEDNFNIFHSLHFNRERNEAMSICTVDADVCHLRILRFTEE